MDYRKDSSETRRLMNGREMQRMVEWAADIGAGVARAAAPLRSGELKSKIKGSSASPYGGVKHDRAEAFIESDARYSANLEYEHGKHFMQAGLDAINSGGS